MIFYIVYDISYEIICGKILSEKYIIDVGFTNSIERIREQFSGIDRIFCRTVLPYECIQDYLSELQKNEPYKYYKTLELIIKLSIDSNYSEFTPAQQEYYLLQMGLKSIYD